MHSLQSTGWTHQETKRIAFVFLIAIAVCVPSLFWQNIPTRDSSLYALVSLEFSSGNFTNSFSPDLSPLLTTIGGSINYFVGHPFLSNQIASILLFLPGVLGTYLLARELKGPKVAYVASILYAVCPYTVELATSGGVDAGKLGLLPWLVWATLKWCDDGRLAWGLAVGFIGGVLSYARGEGFLFSVLALMVYLVSQLFSPAFRKRAQPFGKPVMSLLAASVTMALVISPLLLYEHQQTGYFVTHPSQIRAYRLLDDLRSAFVREARASSTTEAIGKDAAPKRQASTPKSEDLYQGVPWSKNIEKSIKGLYIPYLILILFAVVRHFNGSRCLTRRDLFPLIFIGLNFAIFFPTNICNARYFQSLIPLHLHLAAVGFVAAGTVLTDSFSFSQRKIKILAILSFAVFALLAQKECDFFRSSEKIKEAQALKMMGEWISRNRQKFPFYGTLSNSRAFHNGRIPIILAPDFRICYYAQSDCVILPREKTLSAQWIINLCKKNKVSLLFYSDVIKENNPDFDRYWPTDPAFQLLDTSTIPLASDQGFGLIVFNHGS